MGIEAIQRCQQAPLWWKSACESIGVDAKGSLYRYLYDGTNGKAEGYKIEGIGQDFLPDTVDLDLIDDESQNQVKLKSPNIFFIQY